MIVTYSNSKPIKNLVGFFVFYKYVYSHSFDRFTPFVKKLKEKTPIKGELILREEVEKGQRKEFTISLDDLKSQLMDTHYCGKAVSDILQL